MKIHNRDLVILFLSSLAILISFRHGEQFFSHNLVWVVPLDTAHYDNGHFPTDWEKLPRPQIADVDGDGKNEIIYATADCKIRVLDASSAFAQTQAGQYNQWPTLPSKAEATLLPSFGIATGRRPIALSTGYLENYHEEGAARQRVIVVVTSGWTILLFDHNLKLIWESNVVDDFPEDMWHAEIAITIAPYPVRIGDKGVVIVGGRLNNKPENPFEKISHKRNLFNAEMGHFSYYAFNGRTGALRWKHEENDFQPLDKHANEKDSLLPEHSFKLHVISQMQHLGESDWRVYSNDILEEAMPHHWYCKDDTNFEISHFKKNWKVGGKVQSDSQGKNQEEYPGLFSTGEKGKVSNKKKKEQSVHPGEVVGISNDPVKGVHIHIPGLPFGGFKPHDEEEDFIKKPNVIIAHLSTGIEVIHLYTGRTVTSLPLNAGLSGLVDGSYYDEINGDGLIEKVRTYSHFSQSACFVFVSSGIPVQTDIFNVSVCSPPPGSGMFDKVLSGLGMSGGSSSTTRNSGNSTKSTYHTDSRRDEIGLSIANPISITSLPSLWRNPGNFEKDLIFLISNGKLSSFSAKGTLNWQMETNADWITGNENSVSLKKRIKKKKNNNISFWGPKTKITTPGGHEADHHASAGEGSGTSFLNQAKWPSLSIYHPETFGHSQWILAVGQDYMVCVSPYGDILTETVLPGQPLSEVTIGDFNGDGFNDIVVIGRSGIYGFSLEVSGMGSMVFPSVVLVLVGVTMVLWFYNNIKQDDDVTPGARKSGAKRHWM